jgi:predicted Zn-dependent protease
VTRRRHGAVNPYDPAKSSERIADASFPEPAMTPIHLPAGRPKRASEAAVDTDVLISSHSPRDKLSHSERIEVPRTYALLFLLYLGLGCTLIQAQDGLSRDQMVQRFCHGSEITSGPEFNRMEAIHTRLQPVLENAPENDIDVALVANNTINAWEVRLGPHSGLLCMPVAMVRFIGQSEGEMAFIVAHELGHALDEACKSDTGRAQVARPTFSGALDRLLGGTGRNALEEQRTCEARADEIGFRIFTAAHYNPFDAAGAFGRLEMYLGDSGILDRLRFLNSNHPVTPERIRHMRFLLMQQAQQ